MPAVRYEFVAIGADQIKAHFRGITAEAQASARAAQQAQTAATRAAKSPANTNGATDKAKALAHVARIRDKHFADEQRAAEASEKRIAAAQGRIHDKALRDRERAERAARRNREIGEQTTQRAIERAELRARQERTQFRSNAVAGVGRAAFGAVGGLAMGASAAAIGATIAATRDAMRVQELANRVSINARKSGEGFIDPTVLRKEWEGTARANPGQTAEGVGGAVQKYITMTGDIGTARRGQGTFATVASATGADVGDIAEVAASLSQHFDVKGLEEMRDVLASLTFQGKEGAFELKDAAAMYQRLAASAAAFGVEKSGKGVKMLGGLTQIARTGTGSAEQAATAIENMFTQFKFKAPKIKAAGVDIYKDGKVRPIEDLIPEVISKVGGTDIAKKQAGLTQIFGEQGIRAINPLVAKYNATFQGTKGTDEQKTAAALNTVRFEIDKAANSAGTWADVMRDAAQAQQDTSARVVAAWEEVVANAANDILPHTENLAGAFEALAEQSGLVTQGLGFLAEKLGVAMKDAGLTKEKTNERFYQEAAGAVSTFDTEHNAKRDEQGNVLPLTPAEITQRTKLVRNRERAKGMAWAESEKGTTTFEQFDASLGEELRKDMSLEDRQNVYNRTLADPEAAIAKLQQFPFLVPDAAEKPMRDLAEQATASKLTGGAVAAPQTIDVSGPNKALLEFTAAVQASTSNLVSTKRADLLGG